MAGLDLHSCVASETANSAARVLFIYILHRILYLIIKGLINSSEFVFSRLPSFTFPALSHISCVATHATHMKLDTLHQSPDYSQR